MLARILPAACLAAVIAAGPARADLNQPAELPPEGFAGQQYVDSKGCVFLRAAYGGQVVWVPRVTRDRKQLCGYAPSAGSPALAEETPPEATPAAPDAAASPEASETAPKPAVAEPAPGPAIPDTPTPVVEPTPAPPVAAPEAVPAEVAAVETPAVKPRAKPKAKAKARAKPAAKVEALPKGEAASVKVLTGPAPEGPEYRLACAAATPVAERHPLPGGGSQILCTHGDGSLEGATYPILVTVTPDGRAIGYVDPAAAEKGQTVASGTGRLFVQVGTYAVPSNAEGVVGRLRDLGFPVAQGTFGNGALRVVYAGPFATGAEAQAALTIARQAGFADALVVTN